MSKATLQYTNLVKTFGLSGNTCPAGWTCDSSFRLPISIKDGALKVQVEREFAYMIDYEYLFKLETNLPNDIYPWHNFFFNLYITNNIQTSNPLWLSVKLKYLVDTEDGLRTVEKTIFEGEFPYSETIRLASLLPIDDDYYSHPLLTITVRKKLSDVSCIIKPGEIIFENPIVVNLNTTGFPNTLLNFFSPAVNNWVSLATTTEFEGNNGWELKGFTWLDYFFKSVSGTQTVEVDIAQITFLTCYSFTTPLIVYEPYEVNLNNFVTDEAKTKHSKYTFSALPFTYDMDITIKNGIVRIPCKNGEYSQLDKLLIIIVGFHYYDEIAASRWFTIHYSRKNDKPAITVPSNVAFISFDTFEITVSDEDINKVTIDVEYNELVELISETQTNTEKKYLFKVKPVNSTLIGSITINAQDMLGASNSKTFNFQINPKQLEVTYSAPQPISESNENMITFSIKTTEGNNVPLEDISINATSRFLALRTEGNKLYYKVLTELLEGEFTGDEIIVTISGIGYSSVTLNIPISSNNIPPTIFQIPEIICHAYQKYLLDLSHYLNNPEGSQNIVEIVSNCPFASFYYQQSENKWYMELNPGLEHIGSRQYNIKAVDSFKAFGTNTFTVRVLEPTDKPNLLIPNQVVTVGETLKLYLDSYLVNIFPYEVTSMEIVSGEGEITKERR